MRKLIINSIDKYFKTEFLEINEFLISNWFYLFVNDNIPLWNDNPVEFEIFELIEINNDYFTILGGNCSEPSLIKFYIDNNIVTMEISKIHFNFKSISESEFLEFYK